MVLGLFTIVLAADSPLKWSGVLNIRHTQRELLAGVLAVRAVLLDSEYVGQGVRNRNSVRRPDPAERKIAGTMNIVLKHAAERALVGTRLADVEATATGALCKAGFDSVDYVAIRDAESLESIASLERPARILAAARVGRTRLIDNMAV